MIDSRSVANCLLDHAERARVPVTNLALQKLLYFAHAIYLVETGEPLVDGYFEAWQYGPVHPAVYQCFKSAGAEAIRCRANALNPVSGKERGLPRVDNPVALKIISRD